MIGQNGLLSVIDEQIFMDEFPRFSIIVGPKGSGKKTLTLAIAYALEVHRAFIEPKVDAVREMIKNAYTVKEPILYVIDNADTMSVQAKNAMLKVCEETPNNAYIVMLVNDISSVLDTLKSRAGIYYMQPYTPQEIRKFGDTQNLNERELEIIADICETPGDVVLMKSYGIENMYNFVQKVVDNIADVSSANALKIADSISFKDGKDGYDIELFLKTFKSICGNELKRAVANNDIETQMYYSAGIKVVTNTLNQIKIIGINKGALFDMFILDIRKEWY